MNISIFIFTFYWSIWSLLIFYIILLLQSIGLLSLNILMTNTINHYH